MTSYGKKQLIEILEIADVNLLMSIKDLDPEDVEKQIQFDINSIKRIFGHCVNQMDKYLSKATKKRMIKSEESFGKYVELYLQISEEFLELIKKTPEEDYNKPIDKGEKLGTIIQRIALHYMGHLGQIYLIRRSIGREISGAYSFVLALSESSRKKLKKEWLTWWNENKKSYS
ncbi:MAG: hypothetical protein H7645_04775 [Candidatus Heimdallarchaeota archaeon]|nr:hypothetical protein [Candidatus Heimdallarchaeota archaeon]MCK4769632.1 hypothetical protein [Candidatus Heimdallarchaeota archaeon]